MNTGLRRHPEWVNSLNASMTVQFAVVHCVMRARRGASVHMHVRLVGAHVDVTTNSSAQAAYCPSSTLVVGHQIDRRVEISKDPYRTAR